MTKTTKSLFLSLIAMIGFVSLTSVAQARPHLVCHYDHHHHKLCHHVK